MKTIKLEALVNEAQELIRDLTRGLSALFVAGEAITPQRRLERAQGFVDRALQLLTLGDSLRELRDVVDRVQEQMEKFASLHKLPNGSCA